MKTTATSYYQPWTGAGNMEPFGRHAYIYVTKKHDFSIAGNPVYSGSQVRELYTSADDATKMQILHDLYPQSRQLEKIKQIFDSRLGTVDEASLATMRDYFAGQEDAKDQTKIAQMRDYYSKLGKAGDQRSGQKKEFRSVHDYVQWLEKNHKTVSPGTKK
jgi:hypothetical protein